MASAEDSAAVVEEIKLKWKWILANGIFNVIGGVLCLIAPITATLVAEAILCATLIILGLVSLSGICFGEQGMKCYYLVLGAVLILVGIFIKNNPFEVLATLTIIIAVVVLLDGFYRVALCCQYRDTPGWCW